MLDVLCQEVVRQVKMLQHADPVAAEKLRSELVSAERQLARLLKAVQDTTNDDDPVYRMVEEKRTDIERIKQQLVAASDAKPECKLPTLDEIKGTLAERGELLNTCREEFLGWMRSPVPEIVLYPVAIKGLSRHMLEARFKLCLVNLLPGPWRVFMQQRSAIALENMGQPLEREIRLLINPIPRYGLMAPEIQRMVKGGMKIKDVAEHFKCDKSLIFKALNVMKKQTGEELKVIPVDSLPNLRRKRKPAGACRGRGEDARCPVSEDLAKQIMDLHAKGYKPKGAAEDLGCRTATVQRFLKWQESQPQNGLDGRVA